MRKYLPEIAMAWSSRLPIYRQGCELMQFPGGDAKMADNRGFGHL